MSTDCAMLAPDGRDPHKKCWDYVKEPNFQCGPDCPALDERKAEGCAE